MKIFLTAITIAIVSVVIYAAYFISSVVRTKEVLYIAGQFVCKTLDDSGKVIVLKDCVPMQGTSESKIELINPTNVLKLQE